MLASSLRPDLRSRREAVFLFFLTSSLELIAITIPLSTTHLLIALRFTSVVSTCLWRYRVFHSPAQVAFLLGYSIINEYINILMSHEYPKNAVFHVYDFEINCPIRILMTSAGSLGFLASLFLYSVLHVYLLAYGL